MPDSELIPCVEDQEAFRQDLAALTGDADQIARDFQAVRDKWFLDEYAWELERIWPTNRVLIRAASFRARWSTWTKGHKRRKGYAGHVPHSLRCKTCRKEG